MAVVCHYPDCAYSFAPTVKRDQQCFLDQRYNWSEIGVAPLGMTEEQRSIAIEHVSTRPEIARRAAADVRLPTAGDRRPLEALSVVLRTQHADARRACLTRSRRVLVRV